MKRFLMLAVAVGCLAVTGVAKAQGPGGGPGGTTPCGTEALLTGWKVSGDQDEPANLDGWHMVEGYWRVSHNEEGHEIEAWIATFDPTLLKDWDTSRTSDGLLYLQIGDFANRVSKDWLYIGCKVLWDADCLEGCGTDPSSPYTVNSMGYDDKDDGDCTLVNTSLCTEAVFDRMFFMGVYAVGESTTSKDRIVKLQYLKADGGSGTWTDFIEEEIATIVPSLAQAGGENTGEESWVHGREIAANRTDSYYYSSNKWRVRMVVVDEDDTVLGSSEADLYWGL